MRSATSGETEVSLSSANSRGMLFTIALAVTGLALTVLGSGVASAGEISGPPSEPNGYTLVTTIPLPGPEGHGDWVAFDRGNGDLYLSHHGSNLVVLDTKTNTVVANIESPDLDTPDVMTFDPKYVYVTAEKAGNIVVISKADWKIVGTVKTKGPSPDGIWLNAAKHRLYVVSNDANQLEVYTAGPKPKLVATHPLEPAKPESGPDVGAWVPSKHTLYESDDALVLALNPDTGKILHKLDTQLKINKTGATKNMIYDPKTGRLWVGTTDKQVWILNASTLAKIKTVPATEGDDALAFDPAQRLVFAFGGQGFDVYDANTFTHVAYVNTGSPITHSGTVDPITHQVYVYEGQANVLGVYAKR
ncbi:MAG TPA: hypothetical protein VLM91_25575 [Candidatus Methylomirabilis sp.]|nr:hypothetical protein [Candidatus Methylomirabilis sp.]